jgi:hypothetical protein
VAGVEHGLGFVVAGGQGGEALGKGQVGTVDFNGGSGGEVVDLAGGDPGVFRVELLGVDLLVS